jgi:hypothetical protein
MKYAKPEIAAVDSAVVAVVQGLIMKGPFGTRENIVVPAIYTVPGYEADEY